MSDRREPEAEPHFTLPLRQILSMLLAMGLVGFGFWFAQDTIMGIFWTNPYLNTAIIAVFAIGVLTVIWQMAQLINSVRWIHNFARTGQSAVQAPSLLAALSTLLRARASRMLQLSTASSRTILDSIGQRIDEDREITRYLGNTLIFLGLLGTFYGLATAVPALVETIRGLKPVEGESGEAIFARLQDGLQSQLGGMGTAFSSSLLGLSGSLVIGLMELFATHGQNRFYRELEEWLSTITRLGYAGSEEGGEGGDGAVIAQVVDHLAQQMEGLQQVITQADIARAESDTRLTDLADAISVLAEQLGANDSNEALRRVAEAQEALLDRLGDVGEGMDPESRMRLRSIDVQLLRLLEEISAGRQETMAELRTDLSALTRALRQSGARIRDER